MVPVCLGPSAVDVILFMREIMQKQPDLREEALNKLLTMFPSISSPRVLRIALWIFSVHSRSPDEITRVCAKYFLTNGTNPETPELRCCV